MPAQAVRGTAKLGFGALLASGDLKFITSASGTAVSSISIDGCFSAAYDHYLVMRDLLGTSTGVPIRGRLRASGADATGTDYRRQYVTASSTTVAGQRATGETYIEAMMGGVDATAVGFSRTWISNPFASVRTTAWTDYGVAVTGNIELFSWVYEHDLTTSYDGFTVYPSAGTITGSIYVYGLAV